MHIIVIIFRSIRLISDVYINGWNAGKSAYLHELLKKWKMQLTREMNL